MHFETLGSAVEHFTNRGLPIRGLLCDRCLPIEVYLYRFTKIGLTIEIYQLKLTIRGSPIEIYLPMEVYQKNPLLQNDIKIPFPHYISIDLSPIVFLH